MTHWGWYWKVKKKHIPKKLCSNLTSIDSFKFYKGNAKGHIITGFTVQPLGVRAEAYPNHLKITYRNRMNCSYMIAIDRLTCNYGGFRCFFKCPLCQKRMRFLYFAEHSVFLCRSCLNLSYASQRLRPTERCSHMQDKVKKLIKQKGGDLDTYKKPPKMHQNTYQKLKDKHFYYESKILSSDEHENS
jgi:hypothetical protein